MHADHVWVCRRHMPTSRVTNTLDDTVRSDIALASRAVGRLRNRDRVSGRAR